MIVSNDTIMESNVALPPFSISPKIMRFSQSIARHLGILVGAKLTPVPVKLRKENRIKTIQSSLAIEGNTLSLEQVSALIEGKRILGPAKDILEVQNAINVYSDLSQWNALSIAAMKEAHKTLMVGLISDCGKWREKGVGIFRGGKLAHAAPPAKRVPELMAELFAFLKSDNGHSWLIKSCVFHYELEFIHPFSDGNGRMGRLWHQLILMHEDPVFQFLTLEGLIKKNQLQYYKVLGECDRNGDSTAFIEFCLAQIDHMLEEYTGSHVSAVNSADSRLDYARTYLKDKWFSRADYLKVQKDLSSATASRDLIKGCEEGVLHKKGEKNQVRYQFKG